MTNPNANQDQQIAAAWAATAQRQARQLTELETEINFLRAQLSEAQRKLDAIEAKERAEADAIKAHEEADARMLEAAQLESALKQVATKPATADLAGAALGLGAAKLK